jgi:hypothetical protein
MALFAFGCSFTNYNWPTWADIIGKEFEHYENWGKTGGGNQFMFQSIMECVAKNKISKDDTVIVMWTNVSREDRYMNGEWVTPGNIFTQYIYPQSFVKKFADMRGYFIRDFNTILATQTILKSIGCKFYFLSMVSLLTPHQYYHEPSDQADDLLIYFEPLLQQIKPSVHEIVFNFDWTSRPFAVADLTLRQQHYRDIRDPNWPEWKTETGDEEASFIANLSDKIKKECLERYQLDLYHNSKPQHQRDDYHPTPLEHLEYLEKVLPEILITEPTKQWVESMDNEIRRLGSCIWNRNSPERW